MKELTITCFGVQESSIIDIKTSANKFKLFDKDIIVKSESVENFSTFTNNNNNQLLIINLEVLGKSNLSGIISKNQKKIKILLDHSGRISHCIFLRISAGWNISNQ